jgi:hypothetical protein
MGYAAVYPEDVISHHRAFSRHGVTHLGMPDFRDSAGRASATA